MKVKVIGRTIQTRPGCHGIGDVNEYITNPNIIQKESRVIAGKAAGICYMPDDYLSEGIQNEQKCYDRSKMNAKSGHYSVYEHVLINFIIEDCPKIIAMILNSMGLYATSEKSARYTKMNPESTLEIEKYNKWKDIFQKLIKEQCPNRTDKEIEKLAMENARYMISVFTNTTMEYSIPFNRAILMCQWLDEFAENIDIGITNDFREISIYNYDFYLKLKDECLELARLFREALNLNKEDPILVDHKNMGIELFSIIDDINRVKNLDKLEFPFNRNLQLLCNYCNEISLPDSNYFIGDVYNITYYMSFAGLAQAQRHRTIKYKILNIDRIRFIPDILKLRENMKYMVDWNRDFNELVKNDIVPQATMLYINESGRFSDFVLKCKERLCSRAQLEIYNITKSTLAKFYESDKLSKVNKMVIDSMVSHKKLNSYEVMNRCKYSGYTCKEPCPYANEDRIV